MAASPHSTPKRRRVGHSEETREAASASSTPLRGALSGIRSWLSPWRGNSRASAAFGADDSDDRSEVESIVDDSINGINALAATQGDDAQDTYRHSNISVGRIATPNHTVAARNSEPKSAEGATGQSPAGTSAPFPFTFTASAAQSPALVAQAADEQIAYMVESPPPAQHSPVRVQSPLTHNYSLLSRFFAEKAAEETGRLGEVDNRLTEEEVEGCYLLIEESGRSVGDVRRSVAHLPAGDESFEVPRRRGPPARRSWLSPGPSVPFGVTPQGRYDRDQEMANLSGLSQSSSISSARDSRPRSVVAGQENHASLPASRTEPSFFARTSAASAYGSPLSNPFLSGRTGSSEQAARRRHRPLYLGPGMSSTSLASAAASRRKAAVSMAQSASMRTHLNEPSAAPPASSLRQSHTFSTLKRPRIESTAQADQSSLDADRSQRDAINTVPQEHIAADQSSRAGRAGTKAVDAGDLPSAQTASSSSTPKAQPSRTATAVLSILSAEDLAKPPSPARRITRNPPAAAKQSEVNTEHSSDAAPHTAPGAESILNPYQASANLGLYQANPSASRRSRTTEAVEKLKDERRRSTRMRKNAGAVSPEAEPGNSTLSLLEKIERTMPNQSNGAKGQSFRRAQSNSESNASDSPPATPKVDRHSEDRPAPSVQSSTPTSTPPSKSSKSSAEEKTAEAKRRLDAMSSSQSPSNTLAVPSPKSMSSFSYTNAHAPPKPSRLSIAFNANESPGSTGTRDEEDDDDDDDEGQVNKTSDPVGANRSGATTFTFAPPRNASGLSTASAKSSATPSQSVAALKPDSAPEDSADYNVPGAVSAKAPESTSAKPTGSFSFNPPASAASSQFSFKTSAPTGASEPQSQHGTSRSSKSARSDALAQPIPSLPSFDLSVSIAAASPSQWLARSATTSEEQRQIAKKTAVQDLPVFDLSSPPHTSASHTVGLGNGVAATHPASVTNGAGGAVAANTPATQGAGTQSGAESAPDAGEASSSASALLGSGEGEEGEATLFEVRAKFWRFAGGKWEDLGVGIARIKRQADDEKASRRLLVRNVGNGAVSVNFNLVPDFTAKQDATALSFTGFDGEGKGLPMRCKVKTKESAAEFKAALEA
ncbi:unnamed protein product [Parajaminaea phylloscopi]